MYKKNLLPTPSTKTCSKCRRTLPINQFHKDKTQRYWLSAYCKECTKKRHIIRKIKDDMMLKILRESRNGKK